MANSPEAVNVAILLATFNGEAFLPQQLESFVAQTHKNWQLLVSDDGSVDQTVDIVEKFAQTVCQRVKIVRGPGQGFCRNFIWLAKSATDADLIAFSDQDDVWLPHKLARAVSWLGSASDKVPRVYFSRTAIIDGEGELLGLSPLFRRAPAFQNALVQSIGGGNTMVMNKAAKRLLELTPDTVNPVSHDWWTYQLITGAGGIVFYDQLPSLNYRQHDRNLVGSNKGPRQIFLRAMSFMNRRMKNWNNSNLAALEEVSHLFTSAALSTMDRFARARVSALPSRIWLLWRSGVYRQNPFETLALFLGALFGLL